MNATVLAEIGSWIAVHSSPFVFGNRSQVPQVANCYWTASRCRLGRWATALKMFDKDIELDSPDHDPWPAIEIVVQEILVSELLTRVFSAAMVTHDWNKESDELHGLAHSIHVGQIEARNRALRIMLKGQAKNETAFDRLNALRRRIERWTDLFLAQLPVCKNARSFAFDAERVSDFRLENRQSADGATAKRQQIFAASLAADLQNLSARYPANPALNRDIASGVLACFPADRFDSHGLPKSIRLIWMEQSQEETGILIQQLAELEAKGSGWRER